MIFPNNNRRLTNKTVRNVIRLEVKDVLSKYLPLLDVRFKEVNVNGYWFLSETDREDYEGYRETLATRQQRLNEYFTLSLEFYLLETEGEMCEDILDSVYRSVIRLFISSDVNLKGIPVDKGYLAKLMNR